MDTVTVVHDLTMKLLSVSNDATPDSIATDYYALLAKVEAAVEKQQVKQGKRVGHVG